MIEHHCIASRVHALCIQKYKIPISFPFPHNIIVFDFSQKDFIVSKEIAPDLQKTPYTLNQRIFIHGQARFIDTDRQIIIYHRISHINMENSKIHRKDLPDYRSVQ